MTNERQGSYDCIGKQNTPVCMCQINTFHTARLKERSKFKQDSQANDGIIAQDEKMGENREV